MLGAVNAEGSGRQEDDTLWHHFEAISDRLSPTRFWGLYDVYFNFENICASLFACMSIVKLGMLSKPKPRGGPSSLSGSIAE
jgi:hypothetical protein